MSAKEPKASLLVVDDEKHQRESLAMILEDEGYRVTAAADGREALAKAAEIQPEVVLTDLKMPGLTGMDVVKSLSSLSDGPLAPKVILVTAHGSVERAREAHHLGAFDYMSKPVVADELLFRVERAVEAFRLAEKSAPPRAAPEARRARGHRRRERARCATSSGSSRRSRPRTPRFSSAANRARARSSSRARFTRARTAPRNPSSP